MRLQCPQCNATINLEDPRDAPEVVKCWMCNSTINTPTRESGPKTIKSSSSAGPRENADPIALGLYAGLKALEGELPVKERVRLELVSELTPGIVFEITKTLTTIRRKGGGADTELDDPEISRSHCAIEVGTEGILLHDLRSTNGTYLRGSPVTVI